MQRKDSLTVIRDHVIATDGQAASPGMKAVEIERALERAGLTIISTEAVTLLAYIISRNGITAEKLDRIMLDLKLATVVAYDPALHTGGHNGMEPGDPFLKYSDGLTALFRRIRPHIEATVQ